MSILKSKLSDFIAKYNLNKTNEIVKIVSSNGNLSCDFITADKTSVGFLKMEKVGLPDCTLGVYDTSLLLSLLDFLSSELDVELNYNQSGVVESIDLSDGVGSIKFVTCNPIIVNGGNDVEELDEENEPEYDVNIVVNDEFISNYTKSINALGGTDTCQMFTVVSNGKTTEFLMNYNNGKASTAKFKVDVVNDTHNEMAEGEVVIKTDFIKKVLENNKKSTNAVLSISKLGLVKIDITSGDFKGVYITSPINQSN